MISLTRLDGSRFVLNADLIETVEARPDTVVTLVTKRILVVKEPPDVVIDRVAEYRSRIGWPIGAVRAVDRSTIAEPDGADPLDHLSNGQRAGRDAT